MLHMSTNRPSSEIKMRVNNTSTHEKREKATRSERLNKI